MKKLLTAIVLFVFVALPMSVMAMTTITDNDLSAVTGQSGVSISADITMNLNINTIAWGDNDGLGAGTLGHAAYVGLTDLAIVNLRMHMRSDLGMEDVSLVPGIMAKFGSVPGFTTTDAAILSAVLSNEFLTIDVYSPVDISGNAVPGGKATVRIGLPTFEIDMASMDAKAGLWQDRDSDGIAGGTLVFEKLGDIYVGKMVALMGKGNYVDISQNETTAGIKIVVGNNHTGGGNLFDSIKIDAASWGDTDGLGGTLPGAHAGYVGLTSLDVEAVKVAATLSINVATASGAAVPTLLTQLHAAEAGGMPGITAFLDGFKVLLANNDIATKDSLAYMFNGYGKIGTTSVDIQLLGVDINVGSIAATAALGITKDLANAATTQNVLGDIFVKGMHLVIPLGVASVDGATPFSWVAISAH